jgi:hypothetical protein
MRCICKKTYQHTFKWGMQYNFGLNAKRTGHGLEVYFEIGSWEMTIPIFIEHFVLLERTKFEKYILQWRFLMPRDKGPILRLFGFEEAPCQAAPVISATIPKNEKPPSAEAKPAPAVSPVTPPATAPDAKSPKPSAPPRSVGRTCTINDQLNPAVPTPERTLPWSLVTATAPSVAKLAIERERREADENDFFHFSY